ncbi:MAG: right-handed parallel beta-helix repeat-containing protein [Ruminococcaceae bacterium]|nr:right-handed parallel beta-helix repeat-containing protein [Oscillospiraceae bacterium]
MKSNLIPIASAVVSLVIGILLGALLIKAPEGGATEHGSEKGSKKAALTPVSIEAFEAENVDYGYKFVPNIVSNVWFGNTESVMNILRDQKEKVVKGNTNNKNVVEKLNEALTELGSFSRYYQYEKDLCIEVNGVKYGAYVEEGAAPIGGGGGYTEIFTTGDYVVDTLSELKDALDKAQSGQVIYLEEHAGIDISTIVSSGGYLDVKPGVTLASNRGFEHEDGTISTGGKIYSSSMSNKAIYASEGSRVTGLILTGGDPNQHLAHHYRAFSVANAPGHSYYYKLSSLQTDGIYVVGNNVTIDNCEIAGFGHGAIFLKQEVKGTHVTHCYIHHNQANGLGYGISHHNGTESIIEYCLFNYNRHSIAATGAPTTGYIARFNIEMGSSLSHCFDIHGGSDRKDGTNIAGTYCEMYNNTFLADTNPYWMRGIPEDYQLFYHNVCVNKYSQYNTGKLVAKNVKIYDNIFDIENKTVRK